MAVKLKINKDNCIGCGACVGVNPEAFVLNNDGKAEVIKEVDNPDEMIALCPGTAIEK